MLHCSATKVPELQQKAVSLRTGFVVLCEYPLWYLILYHRYLSIRLGQLCIQHLRTVSSLDKLMRDGDLQFRTSDPENAPRRTVAW